MSETDKEAIRIVKDLQQNVRKTLIALVSIFSIALFTAIFWGGGINNQVDNNTEDISDNKSAIESNAQNIKELSDLMKDFVTEQKVKNENFAEEDDLNELWSKTSTNLAHLSFWAEAQGYSGMPRGMEKEEKDKL